MKFSATSPFDENSQYPHPAYYLHLPIQLSTRYQEFWVVLMKENENLPLNTQSKLRVNNKYEKILNLKRNVPYSNQHDIPSYTIYI